MTEAAASAVLSELSERGWTLGIAESLTGGALCSEFVAVPGASTVLRGGVVAYATHVKASVLGVDADLLDESGPVCPRVALQMAEGVRKAMNAHGLAADVGVATTGVAGPGPADGYPAGTVHIGVVTPKVSQVRSFAFDGDRASVRDQTVRAALSVMRDALAE